MWAEQDDDHHADFYSTKVSPPTETYEYLHARLKALLTTAAATTGTQPPSLIAHIHDWRAAAEATRIGVPPANLSRRYSRTAGGSYTAFSCPSCGALFGDWFLHNYMIEARTVDAQLDLAFPEGRNRIPAPTGASTPDWGSASKTSTDTRRPAPVSARGRIAPSVNLDDALRFCRHPHGLPHVCGGCTTCVTAPPHWPTKPARI
jgi:hypothetical protein